MSNERATQHTQPNVKQEINPETHQLTFWKQISYKEYFDALENELDDLLAQAKFHIN